MTEMISSKAIHFGDRKTPSLAAYTPEERPIGLQLFGSDPDIMAEAAAKMEEQFAPSVIDINMGCPVPKVAGCGDGCALMGNPQLAGEIVEAVCRAVSLPVTVKMRTGLKAEEINAPELAKVVEQAGASMICVHGRTRAQMYRPPVDLQTIRAVKNAVQIPVMGNGSLDCADAALDMLETTGCDGLMIGRGACGTPWIFAEIAARLRGESYDYPSVEERLETAMEHVSMLVALRGESVGVREARKHVGWYLHGLPGTALVRAEINRMTGLTEILDRLRRLKSDPVLQRVTRRPGVTLRITPSGQDGL